MPRSKPAPERKASGANIEEWQRRGLKIQFRLPESEAKELASLASRRATTPNAIAAEWVRSRLGKPRELTPAEDDAACTTKKDDPISDLAGQWGYGIHAARGQLVDTLASKREITEMDKHAIAFILLHLRSEEGPRLEVQEFFHTISQAIMNKMDLFEAIQQMCKKEDPTARDEEERRERKKT